MTSQIAANIAQPVRLGAREVVDDTLAPPFEARQLGTTFAGGVWVPPLAIGDRLVKVTRRARVHVRRATRSGGAHRRGTRGVSRVHGARPGARRALGQAA